MNNEEKILAIIEELKASVAATKAELQAEIAELEANYRKLNQTVAVIENDHGQKLNLLLEVQMDINRKLASMMGAQKLTEQVEDNSYRIASLESSVGNAGW